MQAIRYEAFAALDSLQFKEVVKPIPKQYRVLVKVHATSLPAEIEAQNTNVAKMTHL